MQALDMADWHVGGRLDGLIHHADHGSNFTAMVYTDRIVELGEVEQAYYADLGSAGPAPARHGSR